ncbi:hypothetical protein [Pseudoduganella chitinolytica]|uniref:Uncharacterized protein n=1 Tax=Pseudoduganella chitinolytica TaxID=34070 RepID=A0ABY8BC70_9BURK|nr:hypothetical protein [Pseudoduganella chitinolytica]WEF33500.1 hypothetical protein PX653_01530 [Pseudoduganella chitinolytica]
MQIDIDDSTLTGLNTPAKAELRKATLEFASDLLTEANRIEVLRNPQAGPPEVTSGMVVEATLLVRGGLNRPRQKNGAKLLRICAAVLSLVVGFCYDANKLQDKTYMMIFVLVVALAIVSVTISTIKE